MPRIVRNCRACTQKFIAKDFLLDLTCRNCQQSKEEESKDDPIIEILDDDDDIQEFDAGVSSEAEDDFHCTQIVEILSFDDENEEEEEDEEDEPLTNLIRSTPQRSSVYNPYSPSKPAAPKPQSQPPEHTPIVLLPNDTKQKHQTSQQLTTCFVCGANLMETIQSGWKGRMDHIKRCSKKHGVQAKDIVEQPDEEFVMDPTSQGGEWHSGAVKASVGRKQTTLPSQLPPFKKQSAPPNALSMLMEGARRVAQQAKQPKEPKQSRAQNNNNDSNTNSKKRQWSSGPKHASRTCPFYKKIPGTDFGTCHVTTSFFCT